VISGAHRSGKTFSRKEQGQSLLLFFGKVPENPSQKRRWRKENWSVNETALQKFSSLVVLIESRR
jgi:hypothetical protein